MIIAKIIVINESGKNITFSRIEIEQKTAKRLILYHDGYIADNIADIKGEEIASLLSSPETIIRIGVSE